MENEKPAYYRITDRHVPRGSILPGVVPVSSGKIQKSIQEDETNDLDRRIEELSETLENAIMFESLQTIEVLLNELKDISSEKSYIVTSKTRDLLATAVRKHRLNVVKLILDNFLSDINSASLSYLLGEAIIYGGIEVAKFLVENGADIFAIRANNTMIELAKVNKRQDIVDVLIEMGSKYNYFNEAKLGHEQAVQFGLDMDTIDNNAIDDDGKTMLHLAVENGHFNTVNVLLDHNVDMSLKDEYGQTPLHIAVSNGYKIIAKHLVNRGAVIMTKDSPKTVLEVAQEKGDTEILRMLEEYQDKRDKELLRATGTLDINCLIEALKVGPNINYQRQRTEAISSLMFYDVFRYKDIPYQMTALHIVSRKFNRFIKQTGGLALIEQLLKHGANPNLKDEESATPFHIIVINCSTEGMTLLLDGGANIDAVTKDGNTALHLAVNQDNDYFSLKLNETVYHSHIKMLIERHCNVEIKDTNGKTALDKALDADNYVIVKLFFDCGIKDCTDERFLSIVLPHAAEWNLLEDVEMLLTKGAPIDCTDRFGRSSLHYSAMKGYNEMTEILLDAHASVTITDKSRKTPLHFAAANGHCDIIHLLIENGSDLTARDVTERTPLNYSYVNNHTKALELLQEHDGVFNYDMLLIDATIKSDDHMFNEALEHNANVNFFIDADKKTALHYAAEIGNTLRVRSLIDSGTQPDCKDEGLFTPLHYAAQNGHSEIVKILLNLKKVKDSIDSPTEMTDKTPLHFAAEYGHNETVEILFSKGANILNVDQDGRIPLHYASVNGHQKVVSFLLNKSPSDWNKKDKWFRTALHYAAKEGHYTVVCTLINSGHFDFNCKDMFSLSPFHLSLMSKSQDTMLFFIESGADINSVSGVLNKTPLHLASEKGHCKAVEMLIEKKVDINCEDKHGMTPLHYVAYNGDSDNYLQVIRLLINNGADVNFTDINERVPSHYAAIKGHWNVFRELILHQFEIPQTSMHYAIQLNDERTVRTLIGSHPNKQNAAGQTALHFAACSGNETILKHLVNQTSYCNELDAIKRTALHYAAEYGHFEATKLLITINSPLSVQDRDGNTPLNLSYKNKHTSITELLEQYKSEFNSTILLHDSAVLGDMVKFKQAVKKGASVTTTTFFRGINVLHLAAQNGHTDLIELLILDYEFDIDSKNLSKKTALHYAVINDHPETCEFLVSSGADATIRDVFKKNVWHYAAENCKEIYFNLCQVDSESQDREGNTPLIIAAKNDHDSIVKLLIDKGANINNKNKILRTALHMAAYYNNIKSVKVLLDGKCNYLCKDKDDMIAYYYAARSSSIASLKIFLDHGIDIHAIGERRLMTERTAYVELARNTNVNAEEIKIKTIAWSTLHSAAYCGCYEIVQFLIDDGAFLGYELKNKQLTPIHCAAMGGHYHIIKLLSSHGIPLDCKDEFGRTALHFACQIQCTELVEYLLSTGKVDPLAETDSNHKPINMIALSFVKNNENQRMIYESFSPFQSSHEKLPIETYGKVFVCGHGATGKSSLSKVLMDRSNASSVDTLDPEEIVTGVTQYTAGIEPHTITSNEIGNNIILYDFAGHTEYYSSHAAVLENLMLHSPAIFVVLFNMTNDVNANQEELYYWFNFIECITAKLPKKSKIIVVGSRADLLSDNEEIEEYKRVVQDIKNDGIIKQDFDSFVAVDCHRPAGKGVPSFISILAKNCQYIIEESGTVSYYCCVLGLFLQSLEEKAISVDNLCSKLGEANSSTLPQDLTTVCQFLEILSDRGVILYIPGGTFHGWIVIDKNMFLTKINGRLLAPKSITRMYEGVASNTGIIPIAALKKVFPEHNPEMIKGFLLSLEICQVIDAAALNSLSTNVSPLSRVKSGELLFFPSLISSESPAKMKAYPKFGWCSYCPDTHKFFTTRFLHLLIQHLALRYPMKVNDDFGCFKRAGKERFGMKYERLCNVWLNGIYWKRNNIEVLVEMSQYNRCVTLFISEINSCEAQYIACSIINQIMKLKNSVCPCISQEFIISPTQLADSEVPIRSLDISQRALIAISDLAIAVLLQKKDVCNRLQTKDSIDDVISNFEPCFCVSPVLIAKLFDNKLAEKSLQDSHFHHFTVSCADILKEFPFEEFCDEESQFQQQCTYLSVREYLSKFSIFTENPVNLAITRMEEIKSREDFDEARKAEKRLNAFRKLLQKPLLSAIEISKPKMRLLFKFLKETSSTWREIGILLGVSADTLEGFSHSEKSPQVKLSQMIEEWLKKAEKPSWQSIINVLENDLNNKRLAVEIQTYLGLSKKVIPPSLKRRPSTNKITPTPSGSRPQTPTTNTTVLHTQPPNSTINIPSSTSITTSPQNTPTDTLTTTVTTTNTTTSNIPVEPPAVLSTTPAIESSVMTPSSSDTSALPITTTLPISKPIHTTEPKSDIAPSITTTVSSSQPSSTNALNTQSIDSSYSFLPTISENCSKETNVDKPSDRELRKCSQYLDDLQVLAGYLGLHDETCQRILSTYNDKRIQGFWILKTWKNADSYGTRKDLIELLEDLELTQAAECIRST